MTIADYVGRTIDLLAYSGAAATGEVQLTASWAEPGHGGQFTTGIQKLAQRFLLELLTEKSSMRYLPNRGCQFLTEARLGYLQTPLDVLASVSSSLVDIAKNLSSEESDADPNDERYASAEVLAVTLIAGRASVTLNVVSLAGASRKVIAPISTKI